MEDLVYKIALTFIPGIGPVLGRRLVAYLGGWKQVFSVSEKELKRVPGVGQKLADKVLRKNALERAEQELESMYKHDIKALFYLDDDYPKLLRDIDDAPIVLYVKGKVEYLNSAQILSVVGTRKPTLYGKQICQKLIKDLKDNGVSPVIVSGLAYGIDYCAHKESLENGMKTIAVLANSLDTVYPYPHKSLLNTILQNGAAISENPVGTKLEPKLFVRRNRIIAGLAQASLIIQSGIKGGALITANYSKIYSRKTFAIPGRINDEQSVGCNWLIKNNRAILVESAEEIIEHLNWQKLNVQTKIEFPNLSPDEQDIIQLLKSSEKLYIDELAQMLGWDFNKILATLFQLEIKGIIQQLPGNFYALKLL